MTHVSKGIRLSPYGSSRTLEKRRTGPRDPNAPSVGKYHHTGTEGAERPLPSVTIGRSLWLNFKSACDHARSLDAAVLVGRLRAEVSSCGPAARPSRTSGWVSRSPSGLWIAADFLLPRFAATAPAVAGGTAGAMAALNVFALAVLWRTSTLNGEHAIGTAVNVGGGRGRMASQRSRRG